ncbi:YwaF family protein [Fictibacillus aquaticus]|uniref:TIGR02206 family membrane protein n=1 Tax=Fictibacillus aquaticus TaxID=2021314 RepID=A0A235FEJ6_9BACL|nr:YwaF family protein [Fictibacillus aquaticus]OYD59569.1 hypothetical protein CGZ90_06675 [Fictibacillus aquaticus]
MNKFFRIGMITAICSGWLLYYPYIIFNKTFDAALHLPFHLCSLMEIAVLYACLKNNTKVLEIIAYPLVIGPALALSFPTGTFDLGGWHTAYFIYYHALLITSGVYIILKKRFSFSRSAIWKAALFIFAGDCVAVWVNMLTGGNYMFIGDPVVYPAIVYYPLLFVLVWVFLAGFHFLVAGADAVVRLRQKQNLAQ